MNVQYISLSVQALMYIWCSRNPILCFCWYNMDPLLRLPIVMRPSSYASTAQEVTTILHLFVRWWIHRSQNKQHHHTFRRRPHQFRTRNDCRKSVSTAIRLPYNFELPSDIDIAPHSPRELNFRTPKVRKVNPCSISYCLLSLFSIISIIVSRLRMGG